MSLQLFAEDVTFLQRFLKCSGFYGGRIDGIWEATTDDAVNQFEAVSAAIAAQLGEFDSTTERHLRTLQPSAQRQARAFMRRVLAAGIPARILSGTRTYAEQDVLYRKGRFGDAASIVTNARGGFSNHNFGIAWDIGIFDHGKYLGNSPLYRQAAAVGKAPGIEWGGDWTSFVDLPHYQLATGVGLASVRTSFEAGTSFV